MGNNIYNWVILPVDRKENFVYKKKKGSYLDRENLFLSFQVPKTKVEMKKMSIYIRNRSKYTMSIEKKKFYVIISFDRLRKQK